MRQVSFAVIFVLLGLCLARPGNIGAEIDEIYSGMFTKPLQQDMTIEIL